MLFLLDETNCYRLAPVVQHAKSLLFSPPLPVSPSGRPYQLWVLPLSMAQPPATAMAATPCSAICSKGRNATPLPLPAAAAVALIWTVHPTSPNIEIWTERRSGWLSTSPEKLLSLDVPSSRSGSSDAGRFGPFALSYQPDTRESSRTCPAASSALPVAAYYARSLLSLPRRAPRSSYSVCRASLLLPSSQVHHSFHPSQFLLASTAASGCEAAGVR